MSISNIIGVLIIEVMDGPEQRIRGKIAAIQYDFPGYRGSQTLEKSA